MSLAIDGPPRHRPKSRGDEAMARARTRYDHLAGKLGVAIADRLVAQNRIVLNDDWGALTPSGLAFRADLGAELDPRRGSRRALCRTCLDWSERRWHIGGMVGAAIASRSFELGWTERPRASRALTVTPAGTRAFRELFGVSL